jgi:hypothetical protein
LTSTSSPWILEKQPAGGVHTFNGIVSRPAGRQQRFGAVRPVFDPPAASVRLFVLRDRSSGVWGGLDGVHPTPVNDAARIPVISRIGRPAHAREYDSSGSISGWSFIETVSSICSWPGRRT